jgi:hypothetical protein
MIKKIVLIVFPIIVLLGLFYYKMQSSRKPTDELNLKMVPLKIIPNKLRDPQCHMYLSGNTFSVQIITKDYKTHFFDDPGCAVLWMNGNKINPKNSVIWAYSMDTKKWIDAKKAYFSISDFETPMHYGFGVHEKNGKSFINFKEMRLRMLRGENMTNPKIRKKILKDKK